MAAIASSHTRTAVASMSALIVAMSISRFAYTPILPVMIEQRAVTHELGAFLASANLLGYLLGAMLVSASWARRVRVPTMKWSLLVLIGTLAAMSIPNAPVIWMLARFGSGVASAFVFVLASSLVFDLRHTPSATALFSSVGAGIAMTGVIIPLAYAWAPHWTSGWNATTGLAVVLSLVTAALLDEPPSLPGVALQRGRERLGWQSAVLFACYGIAGFAYVIPATFLVVIVDAVPALRPYAFLSWIIVGIVACITTFAWGPLSMRFGKPATLTAAFLLMAVSCAAPVSGQGVLPALTAAFSLGASFMSVSMLSLGLIRDLAPLDSARRIGQATAVFGVGQVLGPAFTGVAYGTFHSYAPAFLGASILVVIASACIALTFCGKQPA